jgi:hypothetical protein
MASRETRTFVLGLLAGGVALIVAAAFRIIAGGLFVPELASQTVFSLTPGQVESSSIATPKAVPLALSNISPETVIKNMVNRMIACTSFLVKFMTMLAISSLANCEI